MTKDQYEEIQTRLVAFKYNSLQYTGFEAVQMYNILRDDKELILLYGYNAEDKVNQYHWACNEVDSLINAIKEEESGVLITFVPRVWVNMLEEVGFQLYAVWHDYFAEHIEVQDAMVPLEKVQDYEYREVSDLTLACRGQSRGFSGQTPEWMRQWVEGEEPALPNHATHSTILVKKIEGYIVGVICIATYGHESEKGPILWIREVAVHPAYQRRGIARELMKQAYEYGRRLGSKRAFLMADECNEHAIQLYESLGFKGCPDEEEINMIKL